MRKSFLGAMLLTIMLSSAPQAQAAPAIGEWSVAYAGSQGWKICVQPGGKWYVSSVYKAFSVQKGLSGTWNVRRGLTVLQAQNRTTTAGSFVVKNVNRSTMQGTYMWHDTATNRGGAYNDVRLTYRGRTCTPQYNFKAKYPAPRTATKGPDSYIAIAFSEGSGSQGIAWGANLFRVRNGALGFCKQGLDRKNDCKIVVSKANTCAAIAAIANRNGTFTWQSWYHPVRLIAQRNALSNCSKRAGGRTCELLAVKCSGDK